jgi:cytochrome c-type biogenesis protein CcmE
MRIKPRFLIGGALIAGAILYLITTAIRNTAEYYLTVPEVAAATDTLKGQPLRIAGRVKPASVSWDPSTLRLVFTIVPIPSTNGAKSSIRPTASSVNRVKMSENGSGTNSPAFLVISVGQPKPDMFAENRDVIVEGKLTSSRTIAADQVLTSCPSKYVPEAKQ